MPRLSPTELTNAIVDALDESDAASVLVSSHRNKNPRQFVISTGRTSIELWVYIWNLTHGGGKRSRDEYRIQITGIQPPWTLNPSGPTILIGCEPSTKCFAGFDLSKHRNFSTSSPSIQIPITVLHQAMQYGFSFITKGNDEIAIGIRSDQLLAYCLNADLLHKQGTDADMVNLLSKAASLEEIITDETKQVSPERQRVLTEISKLSRDSSFRRKVTIAYDRRCAVTRMQLRLIDAAHILPVGIEGSTDDVSNGLYLSPTYHRAYDHGLIYLDESLKMQINVEKERQLVQDRLDGGLTDFKVYLNRQIHLPADKNQWPNIESIKMANLVRGIS